MTLRKWAAGIAAFVLLATFAGHATATTYYVNGSRGVGNDAAYERLLNERDKRDGTSSALAWGRLSKANATVKSGDVVMVERILGANYVGPINPACQADTASGWVTYIGDVANPEHASVQGNNSITTPYTSIKGISFVYTGDTFFSGARDSVQYCEFSGPIDWSLTDYSYYGNNHFNGYAFTANKCRPGADAPYTYEAPGVFTRGNEFNGNHFTNLFGSPESDDSNSLQMMGVDSCRFLFNTFDINGNNGIAAPPPSYYFSVRHASYVSFRGCRWNYTDVKYGGDMLGTAVGLVFRDSVDHINMDRDTLVTTDGRQARIAISVSGNWGSIRSVHNIAIDSCYFDTSDMVWIQHHFVSSSITNSTIINRLGSAIVMDKDTLSGKTYITGNTLIGNVEGGVAGGAATVCPVLEMTPQGVEDTLTVENNIFYSLCPSGECGRFAYNSIPYAAVEYKPQVFDTTFWNGWTRHGHYDSTLTHNNLLKSDHNLYAYYGAAPMSSYDDSIGKRSITFRAQGGYQIFTWPGLSAAGHDHYSIYSADSINLVAGTFADSITITLPAALPLSDSTFKIAVARTVKTAPTSGKIAITLLDGPPPPTRSGQWARWCPSCDDSSTYGSPLFADSVFSSFESTNLTRLSLARYLGSDSSDVGAREYTSPPVCVLLDDQIGFFTGQGAIVNSAEIEFRNDGETDSLRITSIECSGLGSEVGRVTLSDESLTIGPDRLGVLSVLFTPGLGRVYQNGRWVYVASGGNAVITGTTNDPVNPYFSIPVIVTAMQGE